ncbi:MAG: hypothetical protein KC620_22890 [Myxococcales bacterium]|nr:hypothetical protein [Myxococcales bacterium]
MPGILITAAIAVSLAVALVLWRLWPVLAGRARAGESRQATLVRWNSALVPMLRKMLDGKLHVALAAFFKSERDGVERTLATWSMEPTLLPDVDFIAIARPGGDDKAPEVIGVAEAAALRALLAGRVTSQVMWGHTAYVQLWPDDIDLAAVVELLTPITEFREQHGLPAPPSKEKPDEPAS